jgi:hypothetical protein
MSKQQWKLLLCAIAAVATLVTALFVSAWFRVDLMGNDLEIDLRSAAMCGPNGVCVSIPLSKFRGFYPIASNTAFFTGIPVLVLLIIQTASRLVTGTASTTVTKLGHALAGIALIAGFSAGYLFAPESEGVKEIAMITVTRTWTPVLFMLGNILAMFAMYISSSVFDDDLGEYKPIKLDKAEKGRLPVTPLSVNKIPTPQGSQPLERLPDSIPLDGGRTRTRPPSGQQRIVENVGRRVTPSGQIPRIEEPGRRMTPSGQIARVDDVSRRLTPSGQIPRVDDVSRRLTPSGQIPRVDEHGRTKPPTQPPAVARTSSPSMRARSATQQPLGGVVEVDARPKSPSQQPLVARTTSPSGIADPRSKSPSQQPFVARTTSPSGIADPRSKSPSQQPLDPRSKSPSQQPLGIDPVQRARTSSSGPIDLAARLSASAPQGVLEPLGAASLEVSIRPPLPQPEPVPPDQIPVDPAAGLTIRKRTPSVVNEPVPDIALPPPLPPPEVAVAFSKAKTADLPDKGMPTIGIEGIDGIAELKDELSKPHAAETPAARVATKPLEPAIKPPDPVFPPYIQNKINYAVTTADVSAQGIAGKREDGTIKEVAWDAIVGVIARRLPPDKPFEGATIVDVVSSAGSTLRLVSWTKIRGGLPLPEKGVERLRGFVNMVAAQALGAKLDAATKLFADTDGQAAQLPTLATLAAHDERLK